MIKLTKTYERQEDSYKNESFDITVNGAVVGSADLMTDENSTYIERIDINEEHRNKGFGTAAIKTISRMYSTVFCAPDNEDARRLYERIGSEMNSEDYNAFGFAIDQNFGVYEF